MRQAWTQCFSVFFSGDDTTACSSKIPCATVSNMLRSRSRTNEDSYIDKVNNELLHGDGFSPIYGLLGCWHVGWAALTDWLTGRLTVCMTD